MNNLEELADHVQGLLSLIQRNHWTYDEAVSGLGMALGVVFSRERESLSVSDLEQAKGKLWTVIQAGFAYAIRIPREETWISPEVVQALGSRMAKHGREPMTPEELKEKIGWFKSMIGPKNVERLRLDIDELMESQPEKGSEVEERAKRAERLLVILQNSAKCCGRGGEGCLCAVCEARRFVGVKTKLGGPVDER